MLNIETDLEGQFQQQAETELPGEIADMIRELHRVMEGITFNQSAATYAMTKDRMEVAEIQQANRWKDLNAPRNCSTSCAGSS